MRGSKPIARRRRRSALKVVPLTRSGASCRRGSAPASTSTSSQKPKPPATCAISGAAFRMTMPLVCAVCRRQPRHRIGRREDTHDRVRSSRSSRANPCAPPLAGNIDSRGTRRYRRFGDHASVNTCLHDASPLKRVGDPQLHGRRRPRKAVCTRSFRRRDGALPLALVELVGHQFDAAAVERAERRTMADRDDGRAFEPILQQTVERRFRGFVE